MEIRIGPMAADDWPTCRRIYEEGIATGQATFGTRERIGRLNGRWRDVMLLERRSTVIGVD